MRFQGEKTGTLDIQYKWMRLSSYWSNSLSFYDPYSDKLGNLSFPEGELFYDIPTSDLIF